MHSRPYIYWWNRADIEDRMEHELWAWEDYFDWVETRRHLKRRYEDTDGGEEEYYLTKHRRLTKYVLRWYYSFKDCYYVTLVISMNKDFNYVKLYVNL